MKETFRKKRGFTRSVNPEVEQAHCGTGSGIARTKGRSRQSPMPKTTAGFTLIELLVVVSIISLLASVVLATLSDARAKARDAQRVNDMRQLQNALELYYLENGSYINLTGNSCNPNSSLEGALNELVTSGYVNIIPNDPLNTTSPEHYCYIYYSPPAPAAPEECRIGKEYSLHFRSEASVLNFTTTSVPQNGYYCLTHI